MFCLISAQHDQDFFSFVERSGRGWCNNFRKPCGGPASSFHNTVSVVQWVNRLLPVQGVSGSCSGDEQTHNGTGFLLSAWSCYIGDPNAIDHCGLVWGGLRPELSLAWQCDNPTWSHTALLSWFHARCRSSFRLHNRHSRLLGGSPVKSLQSHCIHTQFHWTSGSPDCFPSWGTRFQSPEGYLCGIGIFLLALSRYIGDPDKIDHWPHPRLSPDNGKLH